MLTTQALLHVVNINMIFSPCSYEYLIGVLWILLVSYSIPCSETIKHIEIIAFDALSLVFIAVSSVDIYHIPVIATITDDYLLFATPYPPALHHIPHSQGITLSKIAFEISELMTAKVKDILQSRPSCQSLIAGL